MSTPTLAQVRAAIRKQANPAKAEFLKRFFKTAKGQYGYGDVFLGLTVPQTRVIAKQFKDLPLKDIESLLHSKMHEERLLALLLMVAHYKKEPEAAYKAYMRNLKWVNNWDLVDSSAEHIVGPWLKDKDRSLLFKMAKSSHLWTRRVAMLASFHYIKHGEHKDTFKLAEILINDKEDLMHKATGWMLREVGKRVDADILRAFLKKNAARMPRTALRYAIERFSSAERQRWLAFK